MNTLQLLSKFRSAIMGVAIVWVLIFHNFPYDPISNFDPFWIFGKFGFAGVDIFLLVSGFGLYYGYAKYTSKLQFYKKRFLRIIPTFLLVVVVTLFLTHQFSFTNFLLMFFNVGSFVGAPTPTYNWYMTAIMLFYLLFPFYVTFFNKSPLRNTIIGVTVALIAHFLISTLGYETAVLTSRLPIFLIGIYACYLLKTGHTKINNALLVAVAIPVLVVYTYCYFRKHDYGLFLGYGFSWVPFILITPGLLVVLTYLLEKVSKWCPSVIRVLSFLGTISLEIYLIHLNIPMVDYLRELNPNKLVLFTNIFIASVVIGYPLHKIMGKLIKV